mgnify:CR=1 FL=1
MRDRKDLLQYNAEGYYDPTAGKALLNALRNRPIGFVRWMGQPIYICPGNDPKMISDTRLLRQFCRYAIGKGAHPTAPMLCDALRPGDVVTERAMPPLPKATLPLF